MSRACDVCVFWVTPCFWEFALIAEKNTNSNLFVVSSIQSGLSESVQNQQDLMYSLSPSAPTNTETVTATQNNATPNVAPLQEGAANNVPQPPADNNPLRMNAQGKE